MSKSPKRHRHHSSAFKICDFSIAALIGEIAKAKNQSEEDDILKRDTTLELIQYILNKSQRQKAEVEILIKYLKTLPTLMTLLMKSEGDVNTLLNIIAKNIKYERLVPNSLICRLGERGEKFYVILRGTISILVTKEFKLNMTIWNYVKHILLLFIREEVELAHMTIKANKMLYNYEADVYTRFIDNHTKNIAYFMNFDRSEIASFKAYVATLILDYEDKQKNTAGTTVSEYIQASYPDASFIAASSIKGSEYIKGSIANPVILYIYFEVIKQKDGASFGEIALINPNNKRTATIISEKEISLGTLTRQVFNASIKDLHKKKQQSNLRFLQGFKIFSEINYQIMMHKFLNYFKILSIEQNQTIINENTEVDEVYFIQQGEFELTAKMSDDDIVNYIKVNKGGKNNWRYDDDSQSEHNKRTIRLAIIKENDIIGLHDMCYGNCYLFTARCISLKATVFSIENKLFEAIAQKMRSVNKNWKEFTYARRQMFVSRIEAYYNYVKNGKSNDKELLPARPIDRIRQCFSATPRPIMKEVNRRKTLATPIKIKQECLTRVLSGNNNTIMTLPNHFHHDTGPNIKRVINEDYGTVGTIVNNSEANQLSQGDNKSRNSHPLSNYDCNTVTTAYNNTFANAHAKEDAYTLRKSKRTIGRSSGLLISRTHKKQFETAYKSEKFLKRIIGSGYKKRATHQTLLTQMSSHCQETRSLSRDRTTIIDPLGFEKLETQGNNQFLLLKKKSTINNDLHVIYHRPYSPSTLPLNYMDKAKPLRITIKKKINKIYC